MELRSSQYDTAILWVKLGQCVQVLESSLTDHVVRVADESHQDVQGRLKRDLIVVIDDQSLE